MKIKEGEFLSKVTNYQLQTGTKITMRIKVHEIIAGSDSSFVAVPVDGLGVATRNHDLHVKGSSESLALEALLEKTYEMSEQDIYPKDNLK